jgi:hypothetical protein
VFSVAVTEKSCYAFGDEYYYFRSGRTASEGAGIRGASIGVDRKSMGHRIAELSMKNMVSPVFNVAVMEKCCEASGDGEY